MFLFCIILIYILLLSRFTYNQKIINCDKSFKDNIFLTLSMGPLIALNCLRGEYVGNDTFSYKNLFSYYSGQGILVQMSDAGIWWMDEYIDFGYKWTNILFSRISSNYQLFISFIAFFLYISTIYFIKSESNNIVISTILFYLLFYHFYINILRQSIAIAILLLGYKQLKEKNYVKYILFIFVAFLFHKTAIVAVLFIPLMKNKSISFCHSLIIVFGVTFATAMGLFRKIVLFAGYSGHYLSQEGGLTTYAQILLSLIILYVIINLKKNIKNEEKNQTFINLICRIPIVQLCLSIASLNIPELSRFSNYFSIFYLVGVPYLIPQKEKRTNNCTFLVFLLILSIFAYDTGILMLRPEWYSEFDYKFYWQ